MGNSWIKKCRQLYVALGWYKWIQISGNSMFPRLKEGDTTYVSLIAYTYRKPKVDDIVLAKHPFMKECIVKKIQSIESNEDGSKRYYLIGENLLESTDSRSFGR